MRLNSFFKGRAIAPHQQPGLAFRRHLRGNFYRMVGLTGVAQSIVKKVNHQAAQMLRVKHNACQAGRQCHVCTVFGGSLLCPV